MTTGEIIQESVTCTIASVTQYGEIYDRHYLPLREECQVLFDLLAATVRGRVEIGTGR